MFPGSSCHTWTETNGNAPCQVLADICSFHHYPHWHMPHNDLWLFRASCNISPKVNIGGEKEKKKNISFGSRNIISFRPQNYMGASFQAPHATSRQRLMEMHHVSLIILYFRMLLRQITQVCTN